jgi:hypothetical protein
MNMARDCRGCVERALEHVDDARELLMASPRSVPALLAAQSLIVRAQLDLRDCQGVPDDDVSLARSVVAATREALGRALANAGGAR